MTVDERLLVPATPALLDEWCGPVVFGGRNGWRVALAGIGAVRANGDSGSLDANGLCLDTGAYRTCPVLVACVVSCAVFGLLLALEVDADGTHR